MALTRETEIARADMNDEFGVTLFQAKKTADYTIAEARTLAAEIIRAANEAERVARDDAWESEGAAPLGFDMAAQATAPSMPFRRCPTCRHADHTGSPCLNMASDNECTCTHPTTSTEGATP